MSNSFSTYDDVMHKLGFLTWCITSLAILWLTIMNYTKICKKFKNTINDSKSSFYMKFCQILTQTIPIIYTYVSFHYAVLYAQPIWPYGYYNNFMSCNSVIQFAGLLTALFQCFIQNMHFFFFFSLCD